MTADVLCERLVKLYHVGNRDITALQGLDLHIAAGEMVALVGPSGSGKSSLLHILSGHLLPSAGLARVGELDLGQLSEPEQVQYRRDTVGVVWQEPAEAIMSHLSMLDNVALPLELAGVRRARRRAGEVLDALGMRELAHRSMTELSGGELQRVAVAIAAANGPALLLADEPTSALDPASAASVYELLRLVQAKYGTTVIVVSHDPRVSHEVDRVVELRDGLTATEVRSGDGPVDDTTTVLLVDDAGRIRLPESWRLQAGIGFRAEATFDGATISLSDVSLPSVIGDPAAEGDQTAWAPGDSEGPAS